MFRPLACLVLSPIARASVLVVGPGQPFTSIATAVAAAQDGDVVLVKTGTYAGFTITNKALSIVADTGADVHVTEEVRVRNLAATRTVVLGGLKIRPVADAMFDALDLESNAGSIRVVGCELRGPLMTQSLPIPILARGISARLCADVALADCVLVGGMSTRYEGIPGLTAEASSVSVSLTSITGSDAGNQLPGYGYGGGPGVFGFTNTRIITSGCTIRGGLGTTDPPICPGSPGVWLSATSQLFSDDTLIVPGAPGWTCTVPTVPVLLAGGSTAVETAGTSREMRAPLVTREQGTLVLSFVGVPGDVVQLVLADATRFVHRPDLRGVSLVRRRAAGSIVLAGVVAGDGTLSWSLPIGDLGAGVEARVIHAQAVFSSVSGSEFLGSPAEIVLLDAAL